MDEHKINEILLEISNNKIKEIHRQNLLMSKILELKSKLFSFQVQNNVTIGRRTSQPTSYHLPHYKAEYNIQEQINKLELEMHNIAPNYIPKSTDEYWNMNGIKGKKNGWENICGNYFRIKKVKDNE